MISLRRTASPVGAVLLLFTGCGSEAAIHGPEWLASPPRPVTLQVELERDRTVTQWVTERGATLVATAGDGSRFRLRIPPGALVAPTAITIIPGAAVEGLPVGGGATALVQLEPSGLRLLQPATLSITPSEAIPAGEQLAFGYRAAGVDAYLHPMRPDPRTIEMDVLHFSGYGVTRAGPDDPGRDELQRAASYEARLAARIAAALAEDRAAGLGSASERTLLTMRQSLIAYYDAVLRPLLLRAERDDRLASCCLYRYAAWERNLVILLGEPEGEGGTPELAGRRAEARGSVERVIRNLYVNGTERALRQCREEHDLGAVGRILALRRAAELLGVESGATDPFDPLRRCLNFEVEFRSSFDNAGPDGLRFQYEVGAELSAEVDPLLPARAGLGSAPLEYHRFVATGNPKTATYGEDQWTQRSTWFEAMASFTVREAGTRPGHLRLHRIAWELNEVEDPGTNCDGAEDRLGRQQARNLHIVFSPGVPTEITRQTPVRDLWGSGPRNVESNAWSFHWSQWHAGERIRLPGSGGEDDEFDGAYHIALDTTGVAGEWKREFTRTEAPVRDWSLAERGHLLLRHRPR